MLSKVFLFMLVATMQARIDYRILDREREAGIIASLEAEILSGLLIAGLQTGSGVFTSTTKLPEAGFAAISTISYDRRSVTTSTIKDTYLVICPPSGQATAPPGVTMVCEKATTVKIVLPISFSGQAYLNKESAWTHEQALPTITTLNPNLSTTVAVTFAAPTSNGRPSSTVSSSSGQVSLSSVTSESSSSRTSNTNKPQSTNSVSPSVTSDEVPPSSNRPSNTNRPSSTTESISATSVTQSSSSSSTPIVSTSASSFRAYSEEPSITTSTSTSASPPGTSSDVPSSTLSNSSSESLTRTSSESSILTQTSTAPTSPSVEPVPEPSPTEQSNDYSSTKPENQPTSQQRAPSGRNYSFDDDRPWDDFGDYSDDVADDEILCEDSCDRQIYLDDDGNWAHRDNDHDQCGECGEEDSDSEPVRDSGVESTLSSNENWEYRHCDHERHQSEDAWFDHREPSEATCDQDYSDHYSEHSWDEFDYADEN